MGWSKLRFRKCYGNDTTSRDTHPSVHRARELVVTNSVRTAVLKHAGVY